MNDIQEVLNRPIATKDVEYLKKNKIPTQVASPLNSTKH